MLLTRYALKLRRRLRDLVGPVPAKHGRMWRYVSPRRRWISVAVFIVFMGVLYSYWYATNDKRIRSVAKRYLSRLTNADVAIGDAHFSLFGGLQLRDVAVDIPGGGPMPFFRAPTVVLRHRPLALLSGRYEPTEVRISNSRVLVEYHTDTDTYNFSSLLTGGGDRPKLDPNLHLPVIRVVHCEQRRVDITGDLRQSARPRVWDATLTPQGLAYEIKYHQEVVRGGKIDNVSGSFDIDLLTGRLERFMMTGSIPSIAGTISKQYEDWCRRFHVRGDVRLVDELTFTEGDPVALELLDVSLKLPKDQGGLSLKAVTGEIVFHAPTEDQPGGVEFKDLRGKVNPGGATFELNGVASGMGEGSPFEANLVVRNLSVPQRNPAEGYLGRVYDAIMEELSPTGTLDLVAAFARDEDGRVTVKGQARPTNMSVAYRYFPARTKNVKGVVAFDHTALLRISLTGRYGSGRVYVSGWAKPVDDLWTYDVTVRGENGQLDEGLYAALPKAYAVVWDDLAPTGRGSAVVHATRSTLEDRALDIELIMNGQCGLTYRPFPYRIENVFGRVYVTRDTVHIDEGEPVRGQAGPMRCAIYGDITNLSHPPADMNIIVEASRVPLDEKLFDAIGPTHREKLEELQLAGVATYATARVFRDEAGEMTYDVTANVDQISFKVPQLPHPITGGAGEAAIEPGRVIIKGLQGMYLARPIHVSGQVFLADRLGVDVQIDSPAMLLDETLEDAVSPLIRNAYVQFKPDGYAGVEVALRYNTPDQEAEETDYRVLIRPKDLVVNYQGFPLTVRAVGGTVIATPGRIELQRVISRRGGGTAIISGVVLVDDAGEDVDLRIRAEQVPIDAEFLAAVPEGLAPLIKRFKPGGTSDWNLSRFALTRKKGALGDADDPATAPGKAEDEVTWRMEGSIGLNAARADLGLGQKVITGKLRGIVAGTPEGLGIRSRVSLERILISKRELTNLTGDMVKAPTSSILHLRDLVGDCHGGRAAGFAEIRLSDPIQYGVNMSVENVDLNDLFNAGIEDPEKRTDNTGLLAGTVQMIAESENPKSRKASGVLQISEGKLYKMPVLLGLSHVVFLSLPGDTAFSDGVMTYHMVGEDLIFDEIYLTGQSMSIVGSGTMNLRTEKINFTFLAGPSGDLPRLVHVEEFLQNIIRELVEMQVTGTISEPQTRTVPLRGIDAVLRKMLQPGEGVE